MKNLNYLDGIANECPFYHLPFTYSKEKVGDCIVDEGQPITDEMLNSGINVIIIKGAKADGERRKMLHLKSFHGDPLWRANGR